MNESSDLLVFNVGPGVVLARFREGLVPHGAQIALQVSHQEERHQREWHKIQQRRLRSLENL